MIPAVNRQPVDPFAGVPLVDTGHRLLSPTPAHWQAEIARGVASTLPVTAADLMPGLQGPDLGKKLHEIEARWLASDLVLRKSDLLA